ncbi:MAG: hypothetical protein IJ148_01885 [Bacteroidaceae bacterium]|nr:hypothetical protein [Bacteroidaceae bacterium]
MKHSSILYLLLLLAFGLGIENITAKDKTASGSWTPSKSPLQGEGIYSSPYKGELGRGSFLASFKQPDRIFYPETWFHFINGNIRREGITQDLEAIAASGIQGIQFFHGQMGDAADWPGTEEHVECLSPKWESLIKFTAEEAHRLGLRFSLQTCPGWATSGGPWIKPEQAMRHLSYSRTDITGGTDIDTELPVPHKEEWRNWQDIAVLAFPAPEGDTGTFCQVENVEAEELQAEWQKLLSGEPNSAFTLQPTTRQKPHRVRVKMKDAQAVRAIEFNPIDGFNHAFCVQPDIHLRVLTPDGSVLLDTDFPFANWQDRDNGMTFALPQQQTGGDYTLEIANQHDMRLSRLRFSSATRGHNWEMESAWTLRSLLPLPENMNENGNGFIPRASILNLSDKLSADGHLRWTAPQGRWIVLRIGHVNTGHRNGPAPAEATGWEVNKLDTAFVAFQFRNYIGRLTDGPLQGLVDNMLMDSWECQTQTWTRFMPEEFRQRRHYELTEWLPAVFGWVVENRQQTSRFLSDWRRTINDLFVENFYGQMSRMAHEKGMTVSYETAAGDIFPADPMEYYKYADVPMCEYWQPFSHWLANRNYKPIRPTASAAHLYGKPRVSAESFTSFDLTWDEHLSMLREVANQNMVEGVTHTIFHTYTHNPDADRFFPGTSFGGSIGTPFLRKQTWWPFMKSFNTYLARCAFMLEKGQPVSNVLWYIGDEIEQKPDQLMPFPNGFSYDYCNTDALLHRLRISKGRWMTPDGISYDVLWVPDTKRLLPETQQRLQVMEAQGGRIIKDVPIASLQQALAGIGLRPDVKPTELRWLHRRADKADWYMICPQKEQAFSGEVSFRQRGRAELWNPTNGSVRLAESEPDGEYTRVRLDMQRGEMFFLVFHHDKQPKRQKQAGRTTSRLLENWILTFPEGWGITSPLTLTELKPWKDLPLSDEGKAFSGTATYETTVQFDLLNRSRQCLLRLGEVEEIAVVKVNGETVDTLWAAPYQADIAPFLRRGSNTITVEVTSTWFNRLVYDAGQPKEKRKTWVIGGPSAKAPLRPSGLLGPVEILM